MELFEALHRSLVVSITMLTIFYVIPAVARKKFWKKVKVYTLPPKFYWLDESGALREVPLGFMKEFIGMVRQKFLGEFGVSCGYMFIVPDEVFWTELARIHACRFDESGALKEVSPECIPKEITEAFRRELIQKALSELRLTKPPSRAVQISFIAKLTLGSFAASLIVFLLLI